MNEFSHIDTMVVRRALFFVLFISFFALAAAQGVVISGKDLNIYNGNILIYGGRVFSNPSSLYPIYVSPAGTGTDCTQANPCSLDYALTHILPRQVIIYLAPGTYTISKDYTVRDREIWFYGQGASPSDVVIKFLTTTISTSSGTYNISYSLQFSNSRVVFYNLTLYQDVAADATAPWAVGGGAYVPLVAGSGPYLGSDSINFSNVYVVQHGTWFLSVKHTTGDVGFNGVFELNAYSPAAYFITTGFGFVTLHYWRTTFTLNVPAGYKVVNGYGLYSWNGAFLPDYLGDYYIPTRLGIATSSPAYPLDVSGSARVSQDVIASRFVDVQNSAYYVDPSATSIFSSTFVDRSIDLNVSGAVRFTDGSNYVTFIKPYGPFKYGFGAYIQSGGQFIIGSGESASLAYSNIGNPGDETMYVTSDSSLRFISNLQSGWAAKYQIILSQWGVFYPERDNNISLGAYSHRWAAVYGVEGNFADASIGDLVVSGTSSFRNTVTLVDGGRAAGSKFLVIGDDSYLTDVDKANTLGIYGNQDYNVANVKLGAKGPTLYGVSGMLGIGLSSPAAKLDVNGVILARNYIESYSDSTYLPATQLRTWGINKPYQAGKNNNLYIEWGSSASDGGTLYITDHWARTRPVIFDVGSVQIKTGGIPVFTAANGKVGVMLTSPAYTLDVNGDIHASGSMLTGDLVFKNNFRIREDGNSLILYNQKGEPILKIDDNGNIWIHGKIRIWER